MKTIIALIFATIAFPLSSSAQKAFTFESAAQAGIPYTHLDSLYKSAIHDNTSLAVFKTPEEQQQLISAYTKLLGDFGQFLKSNNFKWEKPTRCFNRIYLSSDGKIDYFLYHFMDDTITDAKKSEFEKLLNQFASTYQFQVRAKERFAQCSPVVYRDAN